MPSTYEPIATTTLGSASASITLSSIPATYTDLKLVVVAIPLNSTGIYSAIRVNSDTGSNYSYTSVYGNGASATSSRGTSTATLWINDADTSGANPSLIEVDLFSYAGSTNKTMLISTSQDGNGAGLVLRNVGLWRNTSAITSVQIYKGAGNDYQVGTTATLYGIKNA